MMVVMGLVLHPRLQSLAARLVGLVLLLQVLLPPGLTPPRTALAGADGAFLPLAFCRVALGGSEQAPGSDRDRHGHDHCVLCRLPGLASLGAGPLPSAVLPLLATTVAVVTLLPRAPAVPAPAPSGFAARAPPADLVA